MRSWIGERLVWWPRGLPQGKWIGVASSRLGRYLDQRRDWFAALRQTCACLDPEQTVLVGVDKTSTCPFLERCSQLFRIPLLRFELPRSRQQPVGRWFPPPRHTLPPECVSAELVWPAIVSPSLNEVPARGTPARTPARDGLMVAVSDHIIVLSVRSGGNVEQVVRRRLEEEDGRSQRGISLLIGPKLTPVDLAKTLPEAAWLEMESRPEPEKTVVPITVGNEFTRSGTLNQFTGEGYLIHCTRHAAGPWPNQSMADYRDALILGRDDADHSALATLARIVAQRRLVGSCRAIRGGTPVVCFTAVDLRQLKDLHAFRAHRGRWDFEPYGLCIKQGWLEQRGARRVRYGDPSLWDQLADSERPFFQRRRAGRRGQFDWTVEREWRHMGDIDLTELPSDAAMLFVPTADAARHLSPLSDWPVMVLE